jgi:hypothetical protein
LPFTVRVNPEGLQADVTFDEVVEADNEVTVAAPIVKGNCDEGFDPRLTN